MTEGNVLKLKKTTRVKALAILIVAILMVSSALVFFTNSEASYYGTEGGSVTYHLGSGVYEVSANGVVSTTVADNYSYSISAADNTRSSSSSTEVSVKFSTYYGIKATEYNPEFWSGWGEVPLYSGGSTGMWNWVGPTVTVSWSNIPITVTRTSSSGEVTVSLPSGCTIHDGGGTTFVMADGTASINIAIDYTETVHKIFGGWTLTQDGSDIIYPGDVVAWDVEDLYAKWIVPDLYAKKTVAMKSVSSGTGEITDIVHPYLDVAKKNINGKNNYLSVDLTEYIIKSSETVTSESRSTAEYVDDVDGFFVKGNLIKTTYTVTSGPAGYSKIIGGGKTYYMKSDNTVYDSTDLTKPANIRFYRNTACTEEYSASHSNTTIYSNSSTYTVSADDADNPASKFIVLYNAPVASDTYTVILVDSSGGISIQEKLKSGDVVLGVNGWNRQGASIGDAPYTVNSSHAINGFIVLYESGYNTDNYTVIKVDGSRMFSSIYYLIKSTTYGMGAFGDLPSATYRSKDPYGIYDKSTRESKIAYKTTIDIWSDSSNYAKILGDAIFDNITFDTNNQNTHGGNAAAAIVAGGHRLIMGTNISTLIFEKSNNYAQDKIKRAPVIIGGVASGTIQTPLERDKTAILNDRDDTALSVNIGTYIIIHSGTYNSVMAGGAGGNVGDSTHPLSSYAILKDCLVIDTVAGGGGGAGKVIGHINTGSGYKDGGTFAYLIGAYTMGDFWQDKESGYVWDGGFVTGNSAGENGNTREYTYNQQSSVVQGGSGSGEVRGSTHLVISGDSSVWDCMAGGRDGSSTTSYAYLEITGRAEIRRLACGTITDGNVNADRNCVNDARIYVAEDAMVATVYGAGFDTWSYPSGMSMQSGTITVDIAGGHIGDVFGGGYRGSIGTPSNLKALKIKVMVSGDDTVIEGNVYGGGSGGLNKTKHYTGQNKDGGSSKDGTYGKGFQTDKGNTANELTTGRSYVYGTIEVEITGGTIGGNVYGGGMSVPRVTLYNNSGKNPSDFKDETNFDGKPCQPATVVGNVSVTVKGDAKVNGSVFGAGQGISLNADGTVDKSQYGFNKVIYKDGNDKTIGRLYWVEGGEDPLNRDYKPDVKTGTGAYSDFYKDYAQVRGNVTVVIENSTWYHDSTAIVGSDYTVTASDADANRFIVLHRGESLPTGYNVVMVDGTGSSVTASMETDKAEGASVALGTGTWYDKGGVGHTGTYTVDPDDADDSRTIVLYRDSNPSAAGKYTVIMTDGDNVSVENDKAVNSVVSLKTSRVLGSVYGGGGYGKVYGSTLVNIDSGIIDVNVFGGGLGMSGKTSIEGNRIVYIENQTVITGSVYGGSEVGEDGAKISEEDLTSTDPTKINAVKTKLHNNRAGIVIQGGYITGSVFGGGLMGNTFGNTAVYVGYELPNLTIKTPSPIDYTDIEGVQISINSVFAGGNISTSGDDASVVGAYKSFLVQGTGFVSVYGSEKKSVDIHGSIMGSGNACNTRGDTEIEIVNQFGSNKMTGIHRATKVTIDRSNLAISGRSTVTPVFGQTKTVSIFNIGELIIKGSSGITFDTPMDTVKKIRSVTTDGSSTTEKSPQNRFVFTSGSTIYVRYADDNDNPIYGTVEGFVLMVSTQGEYGAYAIASTAGGGGFSVNKSSSVVEADTSVSDDICCWYVSGISKKIATLYLQLENDSRNLAYNESYITITKFQEDTSIMYTGGVFTKMSNDPNGDAYTFVRPGAESMDDHPSQLALALAYNKTSSNDNNITVYDPTSREMSIANGPYKSQPGTFFKKDGRESDIDGMNRNRSLVSVPMVYSGGVSSASGPMNIYMCLSGKPIDASSYVGYLTLVFQEIKQVNYEAVGPDGTIITTPRYLVANTIEFRADIYIYGSPTSDTTDAFTVEIRTAPNDEEYREGEASTLIPQTYTMAELNLAKVDIIGAGSGYMPNIDIEKGTSTYKLPENYYLAPPGRTFDHWVIKSGGNSVDGMPSDTVTVWADGSKVTINGHDLTIAEEGGKKVMTITPIWKTALNVVFDRNGGKGDTNIAPSYIERGTRTILPVCPWNKGDSGEVFAYWQITTGDGSPEIRYPGEVGTVLGDTVIKAMWAKAVTATFAAGEGGSGSMPAVQLPEGQRYTLPMNTGFTAEGKTFRIWSVSIDGKEGVVKYPGETIRIPVGTSTVTITALWMNDPTMRTVTFYANGGSGTMASQKVADGTKYALPDCGYTAPTGKIFSGWSVSVSGGYPSIYQPGSILLITGDASVTAMWSTKYTVTYGNGGGSGSIAADDVPYGSDYTVKPPIGMIPPSGKSFLCWEDNDDTKYYSSQRITIRGNLSLTAVWTDSPPTRIIFESNGGDGYMAMVEKNSTYTYVLPNCGYTYEDKVFKNWSRYPANRADTAVDMYPGDLLVASENWVIMAIWENSAGNTATIAFNANGGAGTMADQHIYKSGSSFVLPYSDFTAPVGKNFANWILGTKSCLPGQTIYFNHGGAFVTDGYRTVSQINADAPTSGLTYILSDSGTITSGSVSVIKGDVVRYNGTSWEKINGSPDSTGSGGVFTLTAEWGTYDDPIVTTFDSGTRITGKVIITALPNQDNTTGWSNMGKAVVWDLATKSRQSDSSYVGTLLGSIVGNVSFAVQDLKATDSSNEVFLPTIDLQFNRGGAEAHTKLTFYDIQYYSVTFVDHELETVRYYQENTLLTRDLCETPSGSNFNGWYLDSEFVTRYDYNMVINDESAGLRLYARYTYIVTLDCLNGIKYTLQVSQEDEGAMLTSGDLPVPTYPGFIFDGWCKDSKLIYEWSYQSDRVYGDITLYAKWIGEEVRIYFWYKDTNGTLRLFDGDSEGQAPVDGKYDLQQAYMLNTERKLYPTVTYGQTFDVKNPYTGQIILEYVQNTIDFGAAFVKWSVISPNDSTKHVGIYNDTVVGSKVLKYVTDEMKEGCADLWEYYLYHDGGYPRKDWVGEGRPDTMEIHLMAETTKVAIKVTMGLTEEDEKYSPTVTIDDPQEFLVYPNGPNIESPGEKPGIFYDEFGNTFYAGNDEDTVLYWKTTDPPYHYDEQGVLRHNGTNTLPQFYWNSEGTMRYFLNSSESCWTCLDEKDANSITSHLTDATYIKYISFPKNNDQGQQYRTINYDDMYGNTVDSNGIGYLKTVAYAMVNGVEKKFLVEWNDGTSNEFKYTIANYSGEKEYYKSVSVENTVVYYIKSDNTVFSAATDKEVSVTFFTDTKRTIPYTVSSSATTVYASTNTVRIYYPCIVNATTNLNSGSTIYAVQNWYKLGTEITENKYTVTPGDADNGFIVLYQAANAESKYTVIKVYSDGSTMLIRNLSVDDTVDNIKGWYKKGVEIDTESYAVAAADADSASSRFIVLYQTPNAPNKYTVIKVADEYVTSGGKTYVNFIDRIIGDGGLSFYLKDPNGNQYTVLEASKTTMYLKPTSGNYHEFKFTLNGAARSGYTLHGWHNEYVSIANALTPSADQIRTIHLWHDVDGNVTSAKLLSEDTYGNVLVTPLLVGNYLVDPNHADASGNIAVVKSTVVKPVKSQVIKTIEMRKVDDKVKLDDLGSGAWYGDGASHIDASWKYTVTNTDADVEGNIILTDKAPSFTEYTVTVVDSDGFRTILGKYSSGTITLEEAGSGRKWVTKTTTISGTSYTVSSSDANALGNIIIKSVPNNWSGPSSFTVTVILNERTDGTTVLLNDDLEEARGFQGWIVFDETLTGNSFTVREIYADDLGRIALCTVWKDVSEYTVIWKNGDSTFRTDENVKVGSILQLTYPDPTESTGTFFGWKAASGMIDNAYVVSATDVGTDGNITINAVWENTTYTDYRLVLISEIGGFRATYQGPVQVGTLVHLDTLLADGYRNTGWAVSTGSKARTLATPTYVVTAEDADAQHDIVLTAQWAKSYTVTVYDGTESETLHDLIKGESIPLVYENDDDQWKVRDALSKYENDYISKGAKVNDSSDTFTMKYDAVWDQIQYSVHVTQPPNGTIEVYMENRDGSGTSVLLTDEQIDNMVFYHGDKLRLSYTPDNSKIAFIKWNTTNTSYIENASSSNTVLLIQDDCSISVDESTGRMMDIMIAFDDDNLNPKDRQYTRVFMRDSASGDYYEATFIPGVVKMDHYIVKVPYGHGYEVVIWYGWTLPDPTGHCEYLPTFQDAPDEYVLTGTVDVTIHGDSTVVYDIISAGFINSIDDVRNYVDTQYGMIERTQAVDPIFDYLFTSDEYSVTDSANPEKYEKDVKKNGDTKYHIDGDNKVYDTQDHQILIKFYTDSTCMQDTEYDVSMGYTTIYTPVIKGSNGGNIVLYQSANAADKYTVVKITSGNSVSIVTNTSAGDEISDVSDWYLKGRRINGDYTVKAQDADAGGYIVLYQSTNPANVYDVIMIDSTGNVTTELNKTAGDDIPVGDDWYVLGSIIKTPYIVNSADAYPATNITDLGSGYRFADTSGAGHPTRIVDVQGKVVAKVTKYVGILRSELAILNARGLNINNPTGGTPPVVVTYSPNVSYSAYEGFPWTDNYSSKVFALATSINLVVDAESNARPSQTFYLNWVRTDSPADIIIQISSMKEPAHYATVDIRQANEQGGYDYAFQGIQFDLGTAKEGYYSGTNPMYPLEGYVASVEVSNGGNIVLYQSANAADKYTVVKITSDNSVSIVTDRSAGNEITGVNGWFVKGRDITSPYIVSAGDADVGGYIVLYQSANDADVYDVIMIDSEGGVATYPNKAAGDDIPVSGVWYVKGDEIGSSYTVETGDSYSAGLGGGECLITDSNLFYLKIPVSMYTTNSMKILATYVKDEVWYALNDTTFGRTGITYGSTPVTGSVIWGDKLELPSSFGSDQGVTDVSVWVAGLPNGDNVIISKVDNKFTYTSTRDDSASTDNFIFNVSSDTVPEGFVKKVLQDGKTKYLIKSDNSVYDAEGNAVPTRFYKSRVCTIETAYQLSDGDITVYTDSRIIFTPLVNSNFITLTFSTFYGQFDYNDSQMISVAVPAGGSMDEYSKNLKEIQSVSRFIGTYSTGSWEYNYGGFYCGETVLDLHSTTPITTDMMFIAKWTANDANKKTFSYELDGSHADISAIRDAVEAEEIREGELKRFVADTEINMSIKPDSGYMIDIDRTRGELGYILVDTDIYVDVTTAAVPTGSTYSFSSWKLWDTGTPTKANFKVTELTDDARNGFLVYVASWVGEPPHAGSIALVFVTNETVPAMIYANDGDTKSLPSGSWKLWNEGSALSETYAVHESDAVDGFIVFVKDGMTIGHYTAVFATEYGTASAYVDLDYYYQDSTGNKFHKTDVNTVYRYENNDWVAYTVTNVAGHDGQFIVQFSTDSISYKATRDGTFFKTTPTAYAVTKVDSKIYVGTYEVDGDVIKDSSGKVVSIKLFGDLKLTNRIVDLSTLSSKVGSNVYSGNYVQCDPVQGFFARTLDDTERTYYATAAEAAAGSGTPVPGAKLSYSKSNDVVETYMYDSSDHYVLRFYGCEYECFDDSFLQYDITIYGSQLRDIFGTVWSKNNSTKEIAVVSATVWTFDFTNNAFVSHAITNISELPAQYYLKDSYGSLYIGNHFGSSELFKIPTLYLKPDDGELETLTVKYINDNEFVKALYIGGGENPDYYLKKNGGLVHNDTNKTPVNGILYYDSGMTQVFDGDYSMVRTDSKYSTDNEVWIDNIMYHRDGFGNLYYDWLGTPTELPNNRGYNWTFLLKDNIDITIYMKEVSYNINFIINGKKVNINDLNAVSTVASMDSGATAVTDLTVGNTVIGVSGWKVDTFTPASTRTISGDYTVTAGDDDGQRHIVLRNFDNATGEYTVVKLDGNNVSIVRELTDGSAVTGVSGWKVKGTTISTASYTVNASDANAGGFIVIYKTDNAADKYTVVKIDVAKEFYGTDISQYTIVAFDGPSSNRGIVWYTDPDYSNEYTGHNSGHVISPDKYIVDVTLPVAPTNSNTFEEWTLFGTGSYTQMQSVTLTGGSQHLGADTDNFFYIFEAKWNESTNPTGKYKIVYASQYNEFTGENMTITNTTITLKTTTNADFRGWKVWNTGDTMAGGTSYTPKDADAVVINGYKYILLVADWGEDLTYANNVVYASEFGTAPRMDSIRKYQYNVTRDITLYGHSGTYVLYLHDFNNEHDPMKFELMADENNRITIPQDHYGFGNYLFVGWSSFVDSNGKRVYTYVPEESVYVANLPERINLYPYYLCDGNGTKYYDGEETRLELSLDSTLSEKQVLTKGDTAVLKVRYSDHEIYDTTEGTEESYVSGVHAGSYTVYYAAEIRTPKYSGDTSHGNTATESPFYGSSTLKILKIDAYAIAPSAYLKKGDGNIIAVSDPIGLEPSDTSSGNIAVTKEDIVLIGLVPKDVESTTLCDSTETELTRIVLDGSTGKEQKTVKAKIVFTTAETPYYLQDYNLKMIDGSLVVYPSNSSIYEAEGYV